MYIRCDRMFDSTSPKPFYIDIHGHKIERAPEQFPYNYDTYVLWKRVGFDKDDAYDAVYSDRMMDWNYDKFASCCQKIFGDAGQCFDNRKPEDIEVFLNEYFDELHVKIELLAVLKGCHHGNGNPLWVFIYKGDKINEC